jgi:hypothetical protein
VPTAIPATKEDSIICALLGRNGVSSSAIIDKAGSNPSIDIATVATNIAIIATNSAVEIRNEDSSLRANFDTKVVCTSAIYIKAFGCDSHKETETNEI